MPDPQLYDRLCDFRQDAYRNIVSLRESEDLFDDISDGDEAAETVAVYTEMHGKRDLPIGDDVISRSMAYNEAVSFPFEPHDPPLLSRFSDGSFPAWYGSIDWETTVYETCYHYLMTELGREGASPVQWRERKVYLIHCQGLLLDLREKAADFPDLLLDDYHYCRTVGSRCYREGIPGILAPSVRCPGGTNINIFRREALSNARVAFFLEYELDLRARSVRVLRAPSDPPLTIAF